MTGAAEFGVVAFTSLLAMLNPFSAAPIFVSMTSHMKTGRKRTALRASLTAGIALGLFAVGGAAIFGFFGITVPAFQIAGGLLFLISAMKVLQGYEREREEVTEGQDPSVVPIGIPLIAGAGSLSTVMVLAGQAREAAHQAALGVAILVNVILVLLVLIISPGVVSRLGRSGQQILSKVMGLLSAVIGVQFILNGLSTVLMDLMKRA